MSTDAGDMANGTAALAAAVANLRITPLHVVAAIPALLFAAWFYYYKYLDWTDPSRILDGPPRADWIWGNFLEMQMAPPGVKVRGWFEEYGPVFRLPAFFGSHFVATTDLTATRYIFQHTTDLFPRTRFGSNILAELGGQVVPRANGPEHRRLRRSMNPGFGPGAVRKMLPAMLEEAHELAARISDDAGKTVDIEAHLSRSALDIIGRCGLGYEGMGDPHNELGTAFRDLMEARKPDDIMTWLQLNYPFFAWMPTRSKRTVAECTRAIERIGHRLIAERTASLTSEKELGSDVSSDVGYDVLSHVIRNNLSAETRPEARVTSDEVMGIIQAVLFAGHETSSTALTWASWRLATRPDIQTRLRDELRTLPAEPTFEQLTTRPYLENFVHELLRVDNPVPNESRSAAADTDVPLGTPVTLRDGTVLSSIRVRKGTTLELPIIATNLSTEIWGPDALEFNPDRYDRPHATTERAFAVPGPYGNLASFISGPQHCIGWRLAITEIKVVLFVLVRAFHFALPSDAPEIERRSLVTMRPYVKGDEASGSKMPIVLSPLED